MCARCHDASASESRLGPDLSVWPEKPSVAHLVESLLKPSSKIRQGYEPITIATSDGQILTGLLAEDRADSVVLRSLENDGQTRIIARADIEDRRQGEVSIMPGGLVNALGSKREFLDLVRYLVAIAEGGPEAASKFALRPRCWPPGPCRPTNPGSIMPG